MEVQPYRALRMALRVFALLTLVGSLLLIFSDRPLMLRVLVRPPESEVSTLLLFIVREMGGLFLMFGVLLFLASRDRCATWPSFSLDARHSHTLSCVPRLGMLRRTAGYSGPGRHCARVTGRNDH